MIAFATSSSKQMRYNGMLAEALFIRAEFSESVYCAVLYIFVSIMHGATLLTRTPKGASSSAVVFVSMSKPAFDMQYARTPGSGLDPLSHETLTMHPDLCFLNVGAKNFVNIIGVRKLISIRKS